MDEEELSEVAGTEVKAVKKIEDRKPLDPSTFESGPRAVIIGEVDGYQVHFHVYGVDLVAVADGDDLIPFEPGILHAVVANLKEQGVKPYWSKNRESSNSSGGGSSSRNSKASSKKKVSVEDWECPVHGSEYVNTDFWDKEKLICKYYEVAWDDDEDDFTPRPKWGKLDPKTKEPFKTKGEYRWYCKHTSED